jgi:hypothetical protein
VSVFVEDAAESIASLDVKKVQSARFGDGLGERGQRCRGANRAVREGHNLVNRIGTLPRSVSAAWGSP